ncbi:MAG: HAD hydrolase family protein [Patescibacteria group bacterium]
MEEKLQQLQLIVFDFDGVFTDGTVIVDETGKESVVCSRKDTLRFPELLKRGIRLAVISKERNPVVAKRCEKMGVICFQGADNKIDLLRQLLEREKVSPAEAAFVGDDINDVECMEYVGLAFTVADGHERCKAVADYVTRRRGGDHAVREICDLVLTALGTPQRG